MQRVVEVLVGLAPQRRLEVLALARAALGLVQQRLLRAAQLGDVEHHAVDGQRAAVGVALDRGLLPDPQHAAVGGEHPVLEVERPLGGDARLGLGDDAVAVLGVQRVDPRLLVLEPLLGREAEHALDLRADVAQRERPDEVGDVA